MRNFNFLKTQIIALFCLAYLGAKSQCTISTPVQTSNNPFAGCSGVVTITSRVTINSNYDIGNLPITQLVFVAPAGELNWSGNFNLNLPLNAGITVQSGAPGLSSGAGGNPCNAIRTISFGNGTIISCNGNGSNYSFAQINGNGGLASTLRLQAGSNSPVCNGGTLLLTATPTGGIQPYTYAWSGPGGFTSTSQNPSTTGTAGTYSVTVTDGGGNTAQSSVVVTNTGGQPNAPTALSASRCGAGSVIISATVGSGETIDWYAAPTGGTPLAGGTGTLSFNTPTITTTTIFYAQTRRLSSGCISSSRTAVTATVNPVVVPSISITENNNQYCTVGSVFSSNVSNAGTATYQWNLNGNPIAGANASSYTAINLTAGAQISCTVGSSLSCATPSTVTSNIITYSPINPSTTWLGLTSDWHSSSNWSNGIPNANLSAIIAGGVPNQATISANAATYHLTVQSGGGIIFNGSNTLSIYGHFQNNGGFQCGTGEVQFQSCGSGNIQQQISGSTNMTFYNIRLNNPAGLQLNTGAILLNELNLVNGTFTNNGVSFLLRSNSSNTARIMPIPAGAGYSGNITMERFAPGPGTGWAMLGSAVNGSTLFDWKDDFAMSGFTGSSGSAGGFVSVYTYDETVPGAGDNPASYIRATNITNPTPVGKGFWIYLGTSLTSTADITIDVTGTPVTGNFSFPISYTNTGTPSGDGDNLISNPYPCAIDWLSPAWVKTNIEDAVYMWQANNNQPASFINGVSTNGGSRYLASSQGFFVQANGPGAVLTATENIKTSVNPVLIREATVPNMLKVKLSGNGQQDETAIYLTEGASMQFDSDKDARKITMPHQALAFIAAGSAEMMMSINGIPNDLSSYSIPLTLLTPEAGSYQLSFEGLETFTKGSCFVIEDLVNHSLQTISQGMVYNFESSSSQMAGSRFILHISPAPEVFAHATGCSNKSEGSIELNNRFASNSPVEFRHISSGKSIHASFTGYHLVQGGLAAGDYMVSIQGNSTCGNMEIPVSIGSVNQGLAGIRVVSMENTNHGISADFKLMDAGHTSLVEWDFGDGSVQTAGLQVSHSYAMAGDYQVKARTFTQDCNDHLLLNVSIQESGNEYLALEMINGEWFAGVRFQEPVRLSIQLYNAIGQIVKSTETSVQVGQIPVDLSELPGGVYWIKLQAQGKEMTRKVVR